MSSGWRSVVAASCIALMLAGALGCRRTGDGTSDSQDDIADSVIKLLDDSKTDDALSKARRAALDDPSLADGIAARLVTWADGRTAEEPTYAVYLAALDVAPDTAGAYVGLGRLQKSFREGLGAEKCKKVLVRGRLRTCS